MLETLHQLIFADSRNLEAIPNNKIDLVVTSPPYPMIEMWDSAFSKLNGGVSSALLDCDGEAAFELMHQELDKTWHHLARVLKPGAWACINIGDATRTIRKRFQLYSNHTRIAHALNRLGLQSLPLVIWRKQTNAPNKFMGSGMLPAGAYVTLEHEYILIFRKAGKRSFDSAKKIEERQRSSLFWEERNVWFSDIWDFKGVRQSLNHSALRERGAAFPFELAFRLINMYSVQNDWILDPFLGTGTTTFAAMATMRNSIGIEIDGEFEKLIDESVPDIVSFANAYISKRLNDHVAFVKEYEVSKGKLRHRNKNYGFPVITSQESNLLLNYLSRISKDERGFYHVAYDDDTQIREMPSPKRQIIQRSKRDQLD